MQQLIASGEIVRWEPAAGSEGMKLTKDKVRLAMLLAAMKEGRVKVTQAKASTRGESKEQPPTELQQRRMRERELLNEAKAKMAKLKKMMIERKAKKKLGAEQEQPISNQGE